MKIQAHAGAHRRIDQPEGIMLLGARAHVLSTGFDGRPADGGAHAVSCRSSDQGGRNLGCRQPRRGSALHAAHQQEAVLPGSSLPRSPRRSSWRTSESNLPRRSNTLQHDEIGCDQKDRGHALGPGPHFRRRKAASASAAPLATSASVEAAALMRPAISSSTPASRDSIPGCRSRTS